MSPIEQQRPDGTGTPANGGAARAGRPAGALTSGRVWRALAKASFAVLSCVSPTGEPRSSGVVYVIADRRMYVVVAADSFKARFIAANPQVSVTVPVRRGGPLALLFPIPPATISFHATAVVYPADTRDDHPLPAGLTRLLPTEGRDTASVIEITPTATFLTYGIGVSLSSMRHPAAALRRVPVDG